MKHAHVFVIVFIIASNFYTFDSHVWIGVHVKETPLNTFYVFHYVDSNNG